MEMFSGIADFLPNPPPDFRPPGAPAIFSAPVSEKSFHGESSGENPGRLGGAALFGFGAVKSVSMSPQPRKPGRPPSPEGRYQRISVRLPPGLAGRVRAAAAGEGSGLAAWVRDAVEHFVDGRDRGDILPPHLRERLRQKAGGDPRVEAEIIVSAVEAACPPPPERGRWGRRMVGNHFVKAWIPEGE